LTFAGKNNATISAAAFVPKLHKEQKKSHICWLRSSRSTTFLTTTWINQFVLAMQ